jgi:hypothetical protein
MVASQARGDDAVRWPPHRPNGQSIEDQTVYIATFSMGALRLPSHLSPCGMNRAAPADADDASDEAAAVGGWFGSSLDLRRGLDVRDLGPLEWVNESQRAFAAA